MHAQLAPAQKGSRQWPHAGTSPTCRAGGPRGRLALPVSSLHVNRQRQAHTGLVSVVCECSLENTALLRQLVAAYGWYMSPGQPRRGAAAPPEPAVGAAKATGPPPPAKDMRACVLSSFFFTSATPQERGPAQTKPAPAAAAKGPPPPLAKDTHDACTFFKFSRSRTGSRPRASPDRPRRRHRRSGAKDTHMCIRISVWLHVAPQEPGPAQTNPRRRLLGLPRAHPRSQRTRVDACMFFQTWRPEDRQPAKGKPGSAAPKTPPKQAAKDTRMCIYVYLFHVSPQDRRPALTKPVPAAARPAKSPPALAKDTHRCVHVFSKCGAPGQATGPEQARAGHTEGTAEAAGQGHVQFVCLAGLRVAPQDRQPAQGKPAPAVTAKDPPPAKDICFFSALHVAPQDRQPAQSKAAPKTWPNQPAPQPPKLPPPPAPPPHSSADKSRLPAAKAEPAQAPAAELPPWAVIPPAQGIRDASTTSQRLFGRRRRGWDDLRFHERVAWMRRHRLPQGSVGQLLRRRLGPTCRSCSVRRVRGRPHVEPRSCGQRQGSARKGARARPGAAT